MGSICRLPSDMPSLEDELAQRQDNRSKTQQPVGIVVPDSLQERVQNYCWENKVKRKREWESHRMALERMKDVKNNNNYNKVKKNEMQCMLKCYRTSNELELM